MPKIRVDMDRPFVFDIDTMDTVRYIPPEIEVSEEFIANFRKVQKEFFEMQEFLEHAFRYQTGMSPFQNSPFGMKKMGEVK